MEKCTLKVRIHGQNGFYYIVEDKGDIFLVKDKGQATTYEKIGIFAKEQQILEQLNKDGEFAYGIKREKA